MSRPFYEKMRNEINSELIIRLQKGEEKAFEIVFSSFYGSLVNFAGEYLKDREAARNTVQTVFLKLWENRNGLKKEQSLRAYLYTLTRNAAISYLRHLKVSRTFAEKSREMIGRMELDEEALNELDFNTIDLDAIEKIIRDTLETLPDRCREVFILSRYENLKNREISGKLGITLKAVEANINRALRTFRENLKDYLPAGFILSILHCS